MNEPTIETLAQRLERLERENRWWRYGGLGSFLVLAATIMMGQVIPTARVVEAEKFMLKDWKGNIRAVLGPEMTHSPPIASAGAGIGTYGLHLYDSDGKYRAGIAETGPYSTPQKSWVLELRDRNTPTSAYLGVSDGLARLDLRATNQSREVAEREDAEWRKKFNAAKTPKEREKLFPQRTNDVTVSLTAFPKGTSSVSVRHGLGGELDLYLLNRRPSLNIEDEKGTSRVVLGQTKLENKATGVTEERPLSSLVLFDKDGKVVWQAP